MIKKVDKLYNKSPAESVVRSTFLKGLKKLDVKGQKADIIKKALLIPVLTTIIFKDGWYQDHLQQCPKFCHPSNSII